MRKLGLLLMTLAVLGGGACGDDDGDDSTPPDGGGPTHDAGDAGEHRSPPQPGACDRVLCGGCVSPLTIVVSTFPSSSFEPNWTARVQGEGKDCSITPSSNACPIGPGDYHVVISVDGSEVAMRDVTIEANPPGTCCDCGYQGVTINVGVGIREDFGGPGDCEDAGTDEDASAC